MAFFDLDRKFKNDTGLDANSNLELYINYKMVEALENIESNTGDIGSLQSDVEDVKKQLTMIIGKLDQIWAAIP